MCVDSVYPGYKLVPVKGRLVSSTCSNKPTTPQLRKFLSHVYLNWTFMWIDELTQFVVLFSVRKVGWWKDVLTLLVIRWSFGSCFDGRLYLTSSRLLLIAYYFQIIWQIILFCLWTGSLMGNKAQEKLASKLGGEGRGAVWSYPFRGVVVLLFIRVSCTLLIKSHFKICAVKCIYMYFLAFISSQPPKGWLDHWQVHYEEAITAVSKQTLQAPLLPFLPGSLSPCCVFYSFL